jgi:hypothetical protein
VDVEDETDPVDEQASRQRPRELALSAAWNGGLTRKLTTIDGRNVNVIFAGQWTHGFGPDFANAMLEFDSDGLSTGAVEIHYRTSEWNHHGHHLDPRYNDVVLHIVSRHDMVETRRSDGKMVPVAVLTVPDEVLFQIDSRLPEIWSRLGGTVCAEELAAEYPGRIIRTLQSLGDERLQERVARFEGELCVSPANQVVLEALFDAFGYSENREPMRHLFTRLNRHGLLDQIASGQRKERLVTATALLTGVGGFLPLAPSDAAVAKIPFALQAEIERAWRDGSPAWHQEILAPTAWQRGRTRPANHPVARLMSLAALLATTRTDLLTTTLDLIRHAHEPIDDFRHLTRREHDEIGPLGEGRTIGIFASVLVPFTIAYARHIVDSSLEEAAIAIWDELRPADAHRPAKRALAQVAGTVKLRGINERGQQGLLHLDREYCTPRRCFECPIAADVIRYERSRPPADGPAAGN